ncbi:MAG: 4-amino-4-deoxy-L-arabinose transferase-like glycosyltransferase [Candidatus Latescibacterota bacterium]
MRGWLCGILLAAFALRVGAAFFCVDRIFSADEVHWQRMGELLWHQGVTNAEAGLYRPPLYPLFIALVYGVGGENPWGLRLAQAAISTATCLFPYALAKRSGGEWAGICAAALAAVYPFFIFFSAIVMAETLLLFFVAAALWQAQRFFAQPSLRRAVEWGFLLGLGALCKPVILVWLPIIGVIWWGKALLCAAEKAQRLLVLCSALVCVVLPWTLRNAHMSGHFVPISTNVGINLLVGHEAGATGVYRDGADYWRLMEEVSGGELDPVRRDAIVARRMAAQIANDPLRALGLAVRKVLLLWNPFLSGVGWLEQLVAALSSLPLLLLGALGLWQLRSQPLAWSAAALALALTLVHAVFFAHARFRLPIDMALVAPAACWLAVHVKWGRPHAFD